MTHRQRTVLVAAILGSGMATIDASIVNVALPSIERDLGGGLAAQQWIVNAYLLTLGSFLLIGGSLGDIYGERRVFSIGVAGFALMSCMCALSPSSPVLIAARALQGVAGALLVPSSLAIIVGAFSLGERGGAIGSWTAWGGIASVAGPLAGGLIVGAASWRWIFVVNLPLGAVTLALVRNAVPPQSHLQRRSVDIRGAVLCALGLSGVVFALIEEPHHGWSSGLIVGSLVLGLGCLAGFVVWELRAPSPMIERSLFHLRNFVVGNAATLTMYAGLSVMFFFLTLFLQEVAGYSPLRSGVATLPVTLVMFALSKRFGRLADRHGPRRFMACGPLVASAGVLLLSRVGPDAPYLRELLPALLIFALGLSMTVAPLTATVLADAGESDAGIASAINNAIARIAGLIGVSVVSVAIASGLPGDTFARNPASIHAFHLAMVVCAALVASGGVVSAFGIRDPDRELDAAGCAGGQLAGAPEPAAAGSTLDHTDGPRLNLPRT